MPSEGSRNFGCYLLHGRVEANTSQYRPSSWTEMNRALPRIRMPTILEQEEPRFKKSCLSGEQTCILGIPQGCRNLGNQSPVACKGASAKLCVFSHRHGVFSFAVWWAVISCHLFRAKEKLPHPCPSETCLSLALFFLKQRLISETSTMCSNRLCLFQSKALLATISNLAELFCAFWTSRNATVLQAPKHITAVHTKNPFPHYPKTLKSVFFCHPQVGRVSVYSFSLLSASKWHLRVKMVITTSNSTDGAEESGWVGLSAPAGDSDF